MAKDRNTLFPLTHRSIFELYETQLKMVWTPYQIDMSNDKVDLAKQSPEVRFLILQILAFFAQSDAIVNENLAFRFMKDINIPEAIQFYSFQIGIEAIHSHTYALLIDNLISDTEEKDKLFNAVNNFESIKKKAEWMKKWINSQESFSKRLLAFALVEGVFFSGSFCTIFWLRERGIMPGLAHANAEISRDEALHFQLAGLLYKELEKMDKKVKTNQFKLNMQLDLMTNEEAGKLLKESADIKKSMLNNNQEFSRLQREDVIQIVKEAVEIEKEFVFESLKIPVMGINADLLAKYIESCADIVLGEFGLEKIYNTPQPFDFMVKNDIRSKVNFFEHRSDVYTTIQRDKVNFAEINEDF